MKGRAEKEEEERRSKGMRKRSPGNDRERQKRVWRGFERASRERAWDNTMYIADKDNDVIRK
eukprot:1341024-Amorphochlora_amoeboformis.AAC.1